MQLKFGTSGLRGLSEELTGEPSARYAKAFARHLIASGQAKAGDPILIARDFRQSSPEIAAVCADALTGEGFRVFDCGTVPTPALALYGLVHQAAGLMITGSHIPADRNGIKFYRPDGEIDKNDELSISALADAIAGEAAPSAGVGEDHAASAAEQFLQRNRDLLPPNSLVGLRIGVYQHSTVARDLLVDVLSFYGAETVALGRSENFVPVDTEAVSSETLSRLAAWAPEHGLDAIVSADGDGDRPLVADEKGAPLRGDLLGLVACEFLGAQVAVTPVTSNSGLERAEGLSVIRTRVGSPYVIAAMAQAIREGATKVAGFEANGGTLTASDFSGRNGVLKALPTRDSFLPILAVLARAAERRMSLSALAASYRLPVALSDRLENFPVETSARLMAHLRGGAENLGAFLAPIGRPAAVSDIDGLRITLADGRTVHFRPSGNAPEMRCYVEAETAAAAEELLAQGLSTIRSWAEVTPN
ncbi:Phosphoglucosamine mutase [Ensifer sp. M14]|jgi:phosphomannomutase|uniref:phosphomannomutase n=1 Tax=Ensifer sp. M14 TaxID=2203782 RepID=UPI000E1CD032|nr:phosphomannomutase [Ensifer sp. M14]RDL49310.1 Phosphoglucosamine mutase [Ensifer sp. M14]